MRLAKRYRRTHFPRLTANHVRASKALDSVLLTPLVFPKLDRLLRRQLVGVHLGIKTVVRLQHDGQVARTGINGAPRSNRLPGVDLGLHVFQMSLSKTLDRAALFKPLKSSTYQRHSEGHDLPVSGPTAKRHQQYPTSRLFSDRSTAGVLPSQTVLRSFPRGGCGPPRQHPPPVRKSLPILLAEPSLASRPLPA